MKAVLESTQLKRLSRSTAFRGPNHGDLRKGLTVADVVESVLLKTDLDSKGASHKRVGAKAASEGTKASTGERGADAHLLGFAGQQSSLVCVPALLSSGHMRSPRPLGLAC